jgi:predicted TIM-barrel fold metal-dependent hydrolase
MNKMIDCHIHVFQQQWDNEQFQRRLNDAGIDEGFVISLPPNTFQGLLNGLQITDQERLENLLKNCNESPALIPVYWINPLAADVKQQIERAVTAGVKAFKVICNTFMPGTPQALDCYQLIADTGCPILFHSGILWDGAPSSDYNRPANFEPLLKVEKLRFSLAHISWPWVDELIAVYGKFSNAHQRNPNLSCEMFIDTTPGTPRIYRREALTKLFTVGYDIENNIIFGSDSTTHDYRNDWCRDWIEYDNAILKDLNINQQVIDNMFYHNAKRFLTGTK